MTKKKAVVTQQANGIPEYTVKRIKVKIRGETPLLMNKLSIETLEKTSRNKLKQYDPKEEVKKTAYVTEDGYLYIPAEAIYRCILNGASYKMIKGRSLKKLLYGIFWIEPEKVILRNPETGEPLTEKDYTIDLRSVVIQKSRILKARAKVEKWEAEFYLCYYEGIADGIENYILMLALPEAGIRVGLLDYRPEKGGQFGKFKVINFGYDNKNHSGEYNGQSY